MAWIKRNWFYALLGLWLVFHLATLDRWPSLFGTGDEALLAEAGLNMVRGSGARGLIFPYTSHYQGYGITTPWLLFGILGLPLALFGKSLFLARLPSLLAAALALGLLWRMRDRVGPVALLLMFSPSFIIASRVARPEAIAIFGLTLGIFLFFRENPLGMGAVLGLLPFVSPAASFLLAGPFLALLIKLRNKRALAGVLAAVLVGGLGLGVSLWQGGLSFLSRDVYGSYFVPILKNQNPIYLFKCIVKKTYWIYLVRLVDPVYTLAAGVVGLGLALRGFKPPRDWWFLGLGFGLGVVVLGALMSKTSPYYLPMLGFFYLVLAGNLSLERPRVKGSTLALGVLLGVSKLAGDFRLYDPPSKLQSQLEAVIPEGSRVMGWSFYWFVLRDRELVVPLFAESHTSYSEFAPLARSLRPDFLLATETEGGLWEGEPFASYLARGKAIARIPVFGKAGIWRKRRELVRGVVVLGAPKSSRPP